MRMRLRWAVGLGLLGGALGACAPAAGPSPSDGGHRWRSASVAAAGDISPPGLSAQKATSDLLVDGGFDAVLALGDTQYPSGALADFQAYFDPTWGRVKDLIHPAVGNHEYLTPGAGGYFEYFGAAAGDPSRGYYSFDLGAWHLVALNSGDGACSPVPCDASSEQVRWLVADLAATDKPCILAFWHHPRFTSSSVHTDNVAVQPLWDALWAAGADLVLNGHVHSYERFEPQTPSGAADPAGGLRQLVVGTGGAEFHPFGPPKPNSAVRLASTHGVLVLQLGHGRYEWTFRAAEPSTFTDSGRATCHRPVRHPRR